MQEIKLSVLDIDEVDNLIQFQIKLANGISSASLDFYGFADNFKEFASGLLSFPKTIDDNVKYEYGGVGWVSYILLEVFCYENNGHSAIHVILNNNQKMPYTIKSEFYITTVPASINKFGQLLYSWNPLIEKEILWIAESE